MSATIGSIGSTGGSNGGGGASNDFEYLVLCDTVGNVVTRFLRTYRRDSAGVLTVANTHFDGSTAYTVQGVVSACGENPDNELITLCDNNAGVITKFLRRYAISGTSIATIDTALDGSSAYVPQGIVEFCCGNCGNQEILCDDAGSFLRIYPCECSTGGDFELDGVTAYTVTGIAKVCGSAVVNESFCYTAITNGIDWNIGDTIRYVRLLDGNNNASLTSDTYWNATTGLAVTPPVLIGTDIVPCPQGGDDFEVLTLCDDNGTFLRYIKLAANGTITVDDMEMDGTTPYAPIGIVKQCALQSNADCFTAIFDEQGITAGNRLTRFATWDIAVSPPVMKSLVWVNQTTGLALTAPPTLNWLRPCDTEISTFTTCYRAITDGSGWSIGDTLSRITVVDYTTITDGVTSDVYYYNVSAGNTIPSTATIPLVGSDIVPCPQGGDDHEIVILCDNNGSFMRHIKFDSTGVITVTNTTLDSVTAYTPVGTVVSCPMTTADVEYIALCDSVGSFLRRFVRNIDGTTSTVDTALDGTTIYAPVGTVKICSVSDIETFELCDSNGPFLRRLIFSSDGLSATVRDTTLDGVTPYTLVGTVQACGSSGTAAILETCADVGKVAAVFGPELLTNGDFRQSSGIGSLSTPGVGWTTNYTPVANIFAAGAGSYAFFTTNAGSVTGGNPLATPILALTGRSMAVNVGPNLALPILAWSNIYLENGAAYSMEASVAIISNPFGAGIYVNGVQVIPLTAPTALGTWQKTTTVFTWTGASGYHTVSINSNNTAASGNDHCFDNFSLRQAFPARTEVRTNQKYESRVKAVVEQVIETTNCNDDRRDQILGKIAQNTAVTAPVIESHIFNIASAGSWTPANIPTGKVLVALSFSILGGTATVTDADGTAVPLLPVGYSASWSSDNADGILVPPQSIVTVACTGRAVVVMSVR